MKRDSDKKWHIVGIKAELLCAGIRPNEVAKEIYQKQNPCNDWKTGNVGLHILLEGNSAVLVTVAHEFDKRSSYSLEYNEGNLVLCKAGEIVCQVKEISMPNWYQEKTSTMKPMPAFFLHEGKSFLHQTYSGCDYHLVGLQCKFCGAGSQWQIGTPLEVAEVVEKATVENSGYHVCLGGGTRLTPNENVSYFSSCAREIRSRNKTIPIWVEMVPPETDQDISNMVRCGATSFGFNIEIWNDFLRSQICPGKSRVSKNRYLESMKNVISILGPNRIGTCFLVGLEPVKSSIEGIFALTSLGVQPCILPFKPWDKCLYKDLPHCYVDDLIEVSKAAVDGMIKNNICPEKNQGCLLCEGCTIDHDIYKLMVN